MKLYFLVLSLALVQLAFSQNQADDGIWNPLTPAQVDGSDTIKNALVFGVGRVITNAVQAGDIPDTSYDVSGIYTVHQEEAQATNYRFEVQVTGADGTIRRIKCDVNVNGSQQRLLRSRNGPESDTRWDQTIQFGAFQFRPQSVYVPAQPETPTAPVEEPTTTPPAEEPTTPAEEPATTTPLEAEVWNLVDPNEVDTNDEIQRAMMHGISSVVDLAVQNNSMPDSNYDVVGIYSVYKQESPATNYRFEVQVMSDEGLAFRVKCDVNINQSTGRMDTYRWRYGGLEAVAWDLEATFGDFDVLPDEVYLADEDYIDAEDDGLVDLDDGLALLL